jgi:hypothetical protein
VELRELTASDWAQLAELNAHLWILAAVLIGTGLVYALAHALIPSLVLTGDIEPQAGRKLRAPLYAVMAAGLGALAAIVIKATLLALDLLPSMLPRLAI